MNGASDCGPTISTHAPRTGSDAGAGTKSPPCWTLFQLTLPARGATMPIVFSASLMGISTHAPRTGSDGAAICHVDAYSAFQPTLPARGATYSRKTLSFWTAHFNPRSPHGERRARRAQVAEMTISTHAPRTGSDSAKSWACAGYLNFNPRSPHGERLLPW